jgi:hypothetical protein
MRNAYESLAGASTLPLPHPAAKTTCTRALFDDCPHRRGCRSRHDSPSPPPDMNGSGGRGKDNGSRDNRGNGNNT